MSIPDSCPRYRPARPLKRHSPWWAILLQFRHKKSAP
nr:MAG TPA: hypothetical protein [Caudoviricetes sp.]